MTKKQYLESVASICRTLKAAGIPLKWADYLPAVDLFNEMRAQGEKIDYCAAVCSERFGIPPTTLRDLAYKMREDMQPASEAARTQQGAAET